MIHLDARYRAVGLTAICLVTLVVVSSAPAPAAPYCNKATGIAATGDGDWVVTSWDAGHGYDADWQRLDDTGEQTFRNDTYGVARGPNGSLWTLETASGGWARVVRRNPALQPETKVVLGNTKISNGSRSLDRDLAFDGRWLVLNDGEVVAFDPDWSNPDRSPAVQRLVPANATGLVATNGTLAFVTRNGTVHVYEATPDEYERATRFSVAVESTAVDIHPGPNGTWLLLQPGNVTVVNDDGERLDQPRSFFATGGCYSEGGGLVFRPFLYLLGGFAVAIVVVVGAGLIVVGFLVLGVAGVILYGRSRR